MNHGERQAVWVAITELRQWMGWADEVQTLVAHMPVSGALRLDPASVDTLRALRQVQSSGAIERVLAQPSIPWLAGSRAQAQEADQAAVWLRRFHWHFHQTGGPEALWNLLGTLRHRAEGERLRLTSALEEANRLRLELSTALADDKHLNLEVGVLIPHEARLMESLVDALDTLLVPAAAMTDPRCCLRTDCLQEHAAAARILRIVEDARKPDSRVSHVRALAADVREAVGRDTQRSQLLLEQVHQWEQRAGSLLALETDARIRLFTRAAELVDSGQKVSLEGATCRLLPLVAQDITLVEDLLLLRDATQDEDNRATLEYISDTARTFLSTVTEGFTERGECRRLGDCQEGHRTFREAGGQSEAIESALAQLESGGLRTATSIDDLSNPALSFLDLLPVNAQRCAIVTRTALARTTKAAEAILGHTQRSTSAVDSVLAAAQRIREHQIEESLRSMDLEVLQRAWAGGLRINALRMAGLDNVWEVRRFMQTHDVADLPGVGQGSAFGIVQATMRLYEGVRDETPVRVDTQRRDRATQSLLQSLQELELLESVQPTAAEASAALALSDLLLCNPNASHIGLLVDSADEPDLPIRTIEGFSQRIAEHVPTSSSIWEDFLSRPADYMARLSRLGFLTEDEKNMHGDLPQEIVEAVRSMELNQAFLMASLRAYQSFGARFALVQGKVIIGDDMGLGKTLEALAVLAHLRASGRKHFLAVCPAAVVTNWMRETNRHTTMEAHRLHGPEPDRDATFRRWVRRGGVAVTTYDLLCWALDRMTGIAVDCVVFDEAHYIKNPEAKRSIAAAEVIDAASRAILMTGTPLENKVDEFRQLIYYIRPDLARTAPDYLASHFRRHVAPAYIRRNQDEVGTELPELIEVDEWMSTSPDDDRAYLAAVVQGNFMAMRRAAMLSADSMKMRRLEEIVEESRANGRRVIVFSYFRDVLSVVAASLPGPVFGPVTGSMAASRRQQLIDEFSRSPSGAVLVSQIAAGGVGLNIQAASVVVICEPQVKPSMEAQAIARAHRMGQTKRVQVHRLLTVDAVDERLRQLLATKQQEFDEYARSSVIVDHAPDAADGSEVELARIVVRAERERLLGTGSAA